MDNESRALLPAALPQFLSSSQIATDPVDCMQRALLHWGIDSCMKVDRSSVDRPFYHFYYLDGEKLSPKSDFVKFAGQTLKAMPREFQIMCEGFEHPYGADYFLDWNRRRFERLLAIPTEFGRPARKDTLSVPCRGPGYSLYVTVCSTAKLSAEQQNLIYQTIDFFSDLIETNGPPDEVCQRLESLTDRERKCVDWAVKGKTTDEISDILHVSPETVKYRLRQATKKYGVKNRRQLIVQYAIDSGQSFF